MIKRRLGSGLLGLLTGLLLFCHAAQAQQTGPAPDASCVVSALNRNATLEGEYYLIPGVPSQLGQYRVRAVCSDGTVGQTPIVQPAGGNAFVAGPIRWGSVTPIPRSLAIEGPGNISYGQSVQLTVTGKAMDGGSFDITRATSGTNYTSSNPALASVSADGLLTVAPAQGAGYGRQVVISATNEGAAVSRLINIGPRGALAGKVTLADGSTAVAGAQVTIQLQAPLTRFPQLTTDASGNFRLADAPAGDYTLSVLAPASGARGTLNATLPANGTPGNFNIRLNGQGRVDVIVLGANQQPVANAQVLLAHSQYQGEVRAVQTGAEGVASVDRFTAGGFNLTVRDAASGAVAVARGDLAAGAALKLNVRLQAAGAISGRVLDGGSGQPGLQVRLLSALKGLVSQALSDAGGDFRFDSLVLGDGPYTLQAVKDGRVQGSVGNLVLDSAGQELRQDIALGSYASGGSVGGKVTDARGQIVPGVEVRLLTAKGQQFAATTDAQGAYLIGGVPLGGFTVSASADGASASATGELKTNGEQLTVNLQLLASAQVEGRVLLSGGEPAAGAVIELRHATAGKRQATADANGQFRFADVALGSYVLDVAHAASGERALVQGALAAAGTSRSHNIVLPGLSKLRVLVVQDGAPKANARVALALQGGLPYGAVGTTDAAGIVEFSAVPRSAFSLSVYEQPGTGGRHGRYEGVLAQANETAVVEMGNNYLANYSVKGTLFDAQARPLPNQWVRLSTRDMPLGGTVPIPNPQWDEYLVQTDAAGRFEFADVSLNDDGRGRLKLDALIDGQLRGRVIFGTPGNQESVTQDIALYEAGFIAGSVRGTKGNPLSAFVALAGFDDRIFSAGDFTVQSNVDGSYVVAAPLGSWTVTASTLNGAQRASLARSLEGAQSTVAADFTLSAAPAYVRVAVAHALTGRTTRLFIDGSELAQINGSGLSGYFALAAGEHQIEARSDYGDSSVQRISVASGDEGRVFNLAFAFNPARLTATISNTVYGHTMAVTVNGANVGSVWNNGVVANIPLPVGRHEIVVSTDYGDQMKETIDITPADSGKLIARTFAFNPPVLSVQVNAPDYQTRIALNGKDLGQFYNGQVSEFVGLKVGVNEIRASRPDGQVQVQQITVGENDAGRRFNVRFVFNLALLNVHVEHSQAASGTYVYVDGSYIGMVRGSGNVEPPYLLGVGEHTVRGTTTDGLAKEVKVTVTPADFGKVMNAELVFRPAQITVNLTNTAAGEVSRIRINGYDVGTIAGSGSLVSMRVIQGRNAVTAIAADGDTQQAVLDVPVVTEGLSLNANFVFDRQLAKRGNLAFREARDLYSIPAKAGDVLSVRAHGSSHDNNSALWNAKQEVYGPDKVLKASGNGYGYQFNYQQSNEVGDLMAVPVAVDGNYTIALQAADNYATGGYFLSVLRNGLPVEVQPYLDGGTVKGVVYGGDGVTPATDKTVVLRVQDKPGSHQRATTAADGSFSFGRVPTGDVELTVLVDEQVMASAQLRLDSAGQSVTQNLVLPKETRLQVTLAITPGMDNPGSMYVEVSDLRGTRSEGPFSFGAGPVSNMVEVPVLGDSITLKAAHPRHPSFSIAQTVAGAHGQTLPVALVLRASKASGRVLLANGAPASGFRVSALRAEGAGKARAGRATSTPVEMEFSTTYTDAQGAYVLALPVGIDVVVRAVDHRFDSYVQVPVPAANGQDIAVPDIRLMASAAVKALVRYSAGEPIAGAQVSVKASVDGKPFAANGQTDLDGRFLIDGVPANVPLQITVAAGPFGIVQTQDATAAPNQVLELPDFVYQEGSTLNIRLLDGEGKPNPLLLMPQINECGSNKVRVITGAGTTDLNASELRPLTGVTPGTVTVHLFDACINDEKAPLASVKLEIGRQPEYTATLVVPILSGTVKYADGRLVRYPQVRLTQQRPDGLEKNLYSVTDNYYSREHSRLGSFDLVGLDLGDYTVTSDNYSGQNVTVNGNLPKPGNVKLDLVLPAKPYDGQDSDVVGLITADGKPLPGAQVVLEMENGGSWSVYANEEGVYQFAEVPAGRFKVMARHFFYLAEANGSSGGAPLVNLDLVMQEAPYDGSASDVKGVVTVDGAPKAGVPVALVLEVPDPVPTLAKAGQPPAQSSQSNKLYSTVTDGQGAYVFKTISAGPFIVKASSSWDSASAVGNAGTARTITLNLAIVSEPFNGNASSVRGRVTSLQEGVGGALLTLERGNGERMYVQSDMGGFYEFPRVKAGPFALAASRNGMGATASGVAGAQPVLTIDLDMPPLTMGSHVTGSLRHSTGAILKNPIVRIFQNGAMYHYWAAPDGNYGVGGVQAGPFELFAQEGESGLMTTVNGVGAASGTVRLDVVLPPSATISGKVLDNSGRPLAKASVYARSSGMPSFDRYTETDADGNYRLEQLALGQVAVVVQDMASSLLATGALTLSRDQQQATLDMALPSEVAALEGTVVAADGSSPVADAPVTFATSRSFALADSLWVQAKTDSAGKFALPALPVGPYQVVAADPATPELVGMSVGNAQPGQAGQTEIRLGTAVAGESRLTGPEHSFYGLGCSGQLSSGRVVGNEGSNWFPNLFLLDVDGINFPCLAGVSASADKRELVYGPIRMNAVQVKRRVFSPEAGGYLRTIDTFSNTGASAVTIKVNIGTPELNPGMALRVNPVSTSYRYAVLDNPPFAVAFGGVGAPENQPSYIVLTPWGGPNFTNLGVAYRRTLTVPAGASVSLMHYTVLAADAAAANAMAEALSNNTAPSMFDKIGAAEKATIINFQVP